MSAAAEERFERWQRPAVKVPAANQRMLGQQVAEQTIIAQADAGMSAQRIAEVQEEIAARNLSEATTREARTFAKEYDDTARTLVRELEEMEMGQ
jgi:hypothetical protein